MQTIEELTAELTESYTTINQLSARVKELESSSVGRAQQNESGWKSP